MSGGHVTIFLTPLEARSLLLLRPKRLTEGLSDIDASLCRSLKIDKAAARRAARKIEGALDEARGGPE